MSICRYRIVPLMPICRYCIGLLTPICRYCFGSNLALEITPQTGQIAYSNRNGGQYGSSNREGASEASDALGLERSNFGQGHVFRVQSKPSKQPLGLVNMGVPIEKVQAKRVMHPDCGGPTLVNAMYLGFEGSPRNNPSDRSIWEFQ